MANICLACGKETAKGSRAAASSISTVLERFLSKRCKESSLQLDIDAIIEQSHVCRACYKSYTTHQQKDEKLYDATSSFEEILQSRSLTVCKRVCRDEPMAAKSQPTKVSPSVTVSQYS